MRAASVVMTLGIVAVGAGAFLAVATTPAFAPYVQQVSGKRGPREVLPGIYRPEPEAPSYVSGLTGPDDTAPNVDAESGFRVRPGAQQGTIVLEMPRWAGETQAWVESGRRAWQSWQGLVEPGWVEPEWDAPRQRSDPDAPDYGRRNRQDNPYGDVPRRRFDDERGRYDDFENDQADEPYAGPEYWSGQEDQSYAPTRQDRGVKRYAQAPEGIRDARRAVEPSSEDDAARAARRAQDVARDVRAAEAL